MKLDITAKGEYGVAYFENSSIRTTTIGNTIYYNYIDLLDNFGLANTKKLLADLGTECKIIKMLNKNGNPAPMRAVTVKGLQKVWAYAASGEAEMKRGKAKKEEDSPQSVTETVSTNTEGETEVLSVTEEEPVQEEAIPENNHPVEETANPAPSKEAEGIISIEETPDGFKAEVSDEACDFAGIEAIAKANPDPEPPLITPDEVTEIQLQNRQRIQEAKAKREALEARKAELDQAIADGNIEEDFQDFADAPYVQETEENMQEGEETREENNDPDGKSDMLSAPWSPHPKEDEYPDSIDSLDELEEAEEEDVIHLNTDPVSEEDESPEDDNLKVDEPQSREEVFKWINLMDTAIVGGSQVKLIMRQAKRSGLWMVFVNEEWWLPARSMCTVIASFKRNTELHDELIYMCGEEKPATYLPLSMQMIQKKSQTARLRLMVYKGLWWVSVKDARRWLDKYPDYPLLEELKAELMDWTSIPYRKQAIIDMLRETCETYLASHEEGSNDSLYNAFLNRLGLSREVVQRCGGSSKRQ